MCIAIVKPKNTEITDEALKNCYEKNPDGAGIAFSKDNQIYILKGIFNKEQFIESVRKYEKEADGAMLIHCRIGTSGLKDKENCHPHIINKHLVMIHNGIINVKVPVESKVSDTIIFTREYLRALPSNFLENEYLKDLVRMAIGSSNKLCFLNEKGEYSIINENYGVWDNGVWYSNHSYETPKITYYPNNCAGYYKWYMDDDDYYYDVNGRKYENYSAYLKRFYDQNKKDCKNKEENKEPSKNRIKKLKRIIRNMSDKKMLSIGEFPLYDRVNNNFVPYKENFNVNQFVCLDEYSPDLFEEWLYEYDERFPNVKQDIQQKIGA